MTSAYMAVKYPTDHNVFALVRSEDTSIRFKDEAIRKLVEDKLQSDFVATLEDDTIIYTMLDLEQKMGLEIDWVTGETWEHLIARKKLLPNKVSRFCTTELKLRPIVHWWAEKFDGPIQVNIGLRANEGSRVKSMISKLNPQGLSVFKASFEKWPNGNNKWTEVAWQAPNFPLYRDGIKRDTVVEFWQTQDVRFAKFNNCVGCWWQMPHRLKKRWEDNPEKMDWFTKFEKAQKGTFRSDVTYEQVKRWNPQVEIDFDSIDEIDCDTGYCGL